MSLTLEWLVGLGLTVVCRLKGGAGGLEGPVVPETGEDGDLQREEREHKTVGDATVWTATQTD